MGTSEAWPKIRRVRSAMAAGRMPGTVLPQAESRPRAAAPPPACPEARPAGIPTAAVRAWSPGGCRAAYPIRSQWLQWFKSWGKLSRVSASPKHCQEAPLSQCPGH
eukprot:601421-Hanusia_phi.AAC.2